MYYILGIRWMHYYVYFTELARQMFIWVLWYSPEATFNFAMNNTILLYNINQIRLHVWWMILNCRLEENGNQDACSFLFAKKKRSKLVKPIIASKKIFLHTYYGTHVIFRYICIMHITGRWRGSWPTHKILRLRNMRFWVGTNMGINVY